MNCGECDVMSMYFLYFSVNVSVCLVCWVLDSVCELFGERDLSHFYCWVGVLVLCLWSCGRIWSGCEFVVVLYVDEVVVVTVMHVLLFVLHVCLMRECDGVRLTAMLVWEMDEVW